jgi:Tfp pilus assembly protein PilN
MSRQLNLYDARFLPQRDWLSAQNLLLGALLSVFVISVGTAFTRWSIASNEEQAKAISAQLAAERAAFAALTGMLASRKADTALQQEVVDLEQGVNSAVGALTLLRGMTANHSTPVVGEMMRAFSRVATDGLWLTGFVVLDGGQQLEIRGRMLDQALLPAYLKRLEAESVFHGRRFSALDMKGGEWVPPPVPGAVQEPGKVTAAPAGRWYVDFALRTRRDEKEGTGTSFDMVKR